MKHKPASVLIVDDSEKDVELTLSALEEYADTDVFQVVKDGVEALDYLYYRNEHAKRPVGNPKVVFLDLKMPKVDGFEVLRVLKTDGDLKTIPVVVLTSSSETRDLRNSYGLGANAYVVKPVVFSDFLRTVKKLGRFWLHINQPPPLPQAG